MVRVLLDFVVMMETPPAGDVVGVFIPNWREVALGTGHHVSA
jgi:hypothetical protein